ncbi:MAG TPA: hypothetical protein VMT52_14920, partial [Planctomycetota bacterium]|nr:hypothetical protein [Planctomycetota bacterium]
MPPRGLSLPSGAAAKLLSGAPVIDLGLLGEKAAALEPGRPLILLDASGSLLGSGIADPENEVIRVLAREAVDSFDASFFRRRALAALELRRALSLPGPNRAFRLL